MNKLIFLSQKKQCQLLKWGWCMNMMWSFQSP